MACQYSGFGSQYYKRKLGGEIESAEKNFNSTCGCVVPSTSSIEAKKKKTESGPGRTQDKLWLIFKNAGAGVARRFNKKIQFSQSNTGFIRRGRSNKGWKRFLFFQITPPRIYFSTFLSFRTPDVAARVRNFDRKLPKRSRHCSSFYLFNFFLSGKKLTPTRHRLPALIKTRLKLVGYLLSHVTCHGLLIIKTQLIQSSHYYRSVYSAFFFFSHWVDQKFIEPQ